LCKALTKKVLTQVKTPFTAIVSPAVGGIVPGYEMGRQLGLPALYVERVDGEFQLRRNFTLKRGQKVLMVEDIVSTGVSSRECIAAIRKTGAKVVAACCLIDRSGGTAKVGVPLIALAEWKVKAWPADKLPAHLRNTPAVKPGSRGLA
jgi:orotate phosphoribosyltransferase